MDPNLIVPQWWTLGIVGLHSSRVGCTTLIWCWNMSDKNSYWSWIEHRSSLSPRQVRIVGRLRCGRDPLGGANGVLLMRANRAGCNTIPFHPCCGLWVIRVWNLRQDVGVVFTPCSKAHAVWAREQTGLIFEHLHNIFVFVGDYCVHCWYQRCRMLLLLKTVVA